MTLPELSDLLQKLLVEYDAVSLPGMGCFVVESKPSQILNNGKTITPPSRKILFDTSNTNPDNILAREYKRVKNISEGEAVNEIAELLRKIKKELVDNAFVEFPGLGIIKYGERGNFVFEADVKFNLGASYFGLEPVALKIKKEGEVETVREEIISVIDFVEEEESEKDEKREEKREEKLEEVSVEKTDTAKEMINETADSNVQKVNEIEKEERRLSGYKKTIMAVCIVLAVVLLAIALLVIFKEEFMPLLERMLYSQEELEILKSAGK